jgi:predicted ATP-dependent endonuclease of OLD family
MLTYILQSKSNGSDILVIDEPDIYLHSDLQRQLVHILKELEMQVIVATHSVEIITEVESGSLLTIQKKRTKAARIKNPQDLQLTYEVLGSNVNPILTQLAKTRRALFLEGKDFQIISLFARKIGLKNVANRSDFAVIPVEGFKPQKVKDVSKGMEMTLGVPILKSVIFDRDYRSEKEIQDVMSDLKSTCAFVRIHRCKELENFLLNPSVIEKALKKVISKRQESKTDMKRTIVEILEEVAEFFRKETLARYLADRCRYIKSISPELDYATINNQGLREFEGEWQTLEGRLALIPGKEALSKLNSILKDDCGISLTKHMIIDSFSKSDIDIEMSRLLDELVKFASAQVPD